MWVCKKGFEVFLVVILMFFSLSVFASAEKSFIQGVDYFKSGSYTSAVENFENARKQGMRSTALYYNLGSVYFKLKKYPYAERYFSALIKTPSMKYLAEYNLGLIAEKQKNNKQAKKYFESVLGNSKDEKLVFLANKKIKKKKFNQSKKISKVKDKKGSVYLNSTVGYDSNIDFLPIDIGTQESSAFVDALASVDYLLSGDHRNGWIGDAFVYSIRYTGVDNPSYKSDAFDQDQYGVSMRKTQKILNWNTHLKLGFDKLTYGPRDYQSIMSIEAKGRYRLSKNDRLYLRYKYEDINSDDEIYDSLEGWKQKIRAEFRRYNKKSVVQFYYELELNDRVDLLLNNPVREISFSPTRHTFRGKYALASITAWRITGDVSYRMSDYPATATQDRKDDRWKAGVNADYRFDKTMKLKLKFEYMDNASTESSYVYSRQLYSVSLSKLF